MWLLKQSLFLLVASLSLVISSVSASPIMVNFEWPGEIDGSYAASTVNLSSLDRQVWPQALIWTQGWDIKSWDRALRLRLDGWVYGVLMMLENKIWWIGVVNFMTSRADFTWDRTGTAPIFELQYSTESPWDNWTTAGSVDLAGIDELTSYSFSIWHTGDTWRIRFIQIWWDSGKRRNLDDIRIGSAYEVIYSGDNHTAGNLPDTQIKFYSTWVVLADNTWWLERIGYTFAWRNTAEDWSGTSFSTWDIYTLEESLTLYPERIPNTYTVTFQDRDNTFIISWSISHGDSAISPANPIRTWYTFSWWNNDFSNITWDLIIIAQYNPNTYQIAFDSNSGTGIMYNQDLVYDITQNLTSNIFTRTGYTFWGWNTDPNGIGIYYTDNASVLNISAISGSLSILYAQWNINQYTLTFDTDGGTIIDPISQDFDTLIIAPTHPTKTGYIFAGWYPVLPTTIPADNITLTAQRQQRATMTITPSTPWPTNTNFTIDIVFSTWVNNFTAGDIIISSNANTWGFASIISNLHYRLTINPLNNGIITISIDDTAAQDIIFGNDIIWITNYEIVIADITAPTITITNPNIDPAQSKTISASTNEWNLFYSIQTSPICNNTLSFTAYTTALVFSNENNNGTHVCFRAIDLAGNISYQASNAISGIDTTPPVITEVIAISTPTNNTTPSYSFSTTEWWTITYGGWCSSITTNALSGDNIITFNPLTWDALATGTLYDLCTISISDIAGNVSIPLVISPFVIDTVIPTATVSYNITGWINQDVIATLTWVSEWITILNNSGNSQFTFIENGSFEFIFQDLAGNTWSVIATVDNIDKTPPVITVNEANPLTVYKWSAYSDLWAKRSDNISGTWDLIWSWTVDTSILGNYIITYSKTDQAGNTTTSDRIVTVINLPSAWWIWWSSRGGSSVPSIDYCPVWDFSDSYYDGQCGTPTEEISIPQPDTTPISELEHAYNRAYNQGITTLSPIENASLNNPITRAELAKMITVYATTLLNKEIAIDHPWCLNFSDSNNINLELAWFVTQACQLGIMGLQADGKTPLEVFNPNGIVSRAQFATVLSRLLYGNTHNNNNDEWFRIEHMSVLRSNNILTITNPNLIELRWWIILMLHRTQQ